MHFLYLRITGKNLNINNISNTLNLVPESTENNDVWQYRSEIKKGNILENKICDFICELFKKKDYFTEISVDNDIGIYVVMYPDNIDDTHQINISLTNQTIDMLHDMNISFHVTVMDLHKLY